MRIKKRTFASIIRWSLRIGITLVLLGGFLMYTRTDIFTITSYDIQGVDEVIRAKIVSQLEEVMKSNVYLVIPGDKIFTYSQDRVVRTVRSVVPDTATIDMRPFGLHMVKITVTTLTPLFRSDNNQALTEDGILFITKKDVQTLPMITFSSSTVETIKKDGLLFARISQGGGPVPATLLHDIAVFSSKVSSVVFPVESILVEEVGDVTLYNASKTSKVLFLKDGEEKKTWTTLVSAIDTDPLKKKLATEKEKLEYLDVRYGNKVFYRFSDMMFQNNGTDHILDVHATTTQATTTPSR